MVVLNDQESVKDLLDARSNIYSSRPPSHVGDEIITEGNHILLASGLFKGGRGTCLHSVIYQIKYGKTWQSMRKAIHPLLNIR